jgi:dephospho-CoA kinase
MERDNIRLTAAQDRVASQMAISEKIAYADKILDNSAGVVELERLVTELATSLRAKAGWSWRLCWIFPPLGLVLGGWSLGTRAIYRSVGSKQV